MSEIETSGSPDQAEAQAGYNFVTIDLIEGETDYAPMINAALREVGIVEVRLGAGTFLLASPIYLPSGARLIGAGADATTLLAAPGFDGGSSTQGVVQSETRAVGIVLSDFSVDANKVSPNGLRLCGVFMDQAVGFQISRVDVHNVTGYAHFAAGDVNALAAGVPDALATSGSYIECRTDNAQVHFEVMFGNGVTYTDCAASDGDGDIGAEAYFHPLLGSQNISYVGSSGIGNALLGFSLISSLQSLENIRIIDCYIEITRDDGGYGLIDHSALPTLNLQIADSTFVSRAYIGLSAVGISGNATNSVFQGGFFGIAVDNVADGLALQFALTDSWALALSDPNGAIGISALSATQGVTWSGGVIEARGSGALMFPVSGDGEVSAETVLINDGFTARVGFDEIGSDTLLFPGLSLPPSGFVDFAGGSILVDFRTRAESADRIVLVSADAGGGVEIDGGGISYRGVVIGVTTGETVGGAMAIALTADATAEGVEALVRSLAYSAGGQDPGTHSRFIEVTIADGSGVGGMLTAAVHMGTMVGGMAADHYVVGNAATVIAEPGGYGFDDVRTTVADYTLPANVEKLVYVGAEAAILRGNSGDNVIAGGGGDDLIDGGGGADVMAGGLGDDVYVVDDAGDKVLEAGGEGTDEIRTGLAAFSLAALANIENLTGTGPAGQFLTGNAGDNVITGSAGGDLIDGGAGADVMAGGLDDDVYVVDNEVDTALEAEGEGTDEIRTDLATFSLADLPNIENLTGTSGAGQALSGNSGDNIITGGAGEDVLAGLGGADVLKGGKGDDLYLIDGDALILENASEGSDEVRTGLTDYTLPADVEILTYTGKGTAQTYLRGNSGDNLITGGGGIDVIDLRDGGEDRTETGAGNDGFLMGAALSAGDYLDGGAGTNDQLVIQGDYSALTALGPDVLHNIEVLSILSGTETMFGGSGTDLFSYNLKTVEANVAAGQRLFVDFTNLVAGEDVTFDGSAETDGGFTIGGGRGEDHLTGGAGADLFLFRNEGRYGPSDTVNGGAGNDELALRGLYSGPTAIAFQANTMVNIEVLSILSGQNTSWGPQAGNFSYDLTMHENNVVAGKPLVVDAGQLTAGEVLKFDGSAETDGFFIIAGGAAPDTITGGAGNDTLIGGLGADLLTGGLGNDMFRYRSTAESALGAADHILDFRSGDRIDLSLIDADTGTANDQAFTFIGANAFGGHAGELQAVNTGGNAWTVSGDVDGDCLADFQILVTAADGYALGSGDFLP